jgi:hypothetical protein
MTNVVLLRDTLVLAFHALEKFNFPSATKLLKRKVRLNNELERS